MINAHNTFDVDSTAFVMLETATVQILNQNNDFIIFIHLYVKFDSVSQNCITEEICQLLKLKLTKISCNVTSIGQLS